MPGRDLFPEAFARTLSAGKPYRPSNGTEGEMFMERFCYECQKCDADGDGQDDCEINLNAFVFDVGEPEYPKEWVIDARGQPCCTAFLPHGADPPLKPAPGQLELFGAPDDPP